MIHQSPAVSDALQNGFFHSGMLQELSTPESTPKSASRGVLINMYRHLKKKKQTSFIILHI
jgi:hypothetical protein